MSKIELTPGELCALELIERTLDAIDQIEPNVSLRENRAELYQAIHVLQGFVKQHILSRLQGSPFVNWWSQDLRPLPQEELVELVRRQLEE